LLSKNRERKKNKLKTQLKNKVAKIHFKKHKNTETHMYLIIINTKTQINTN